MSVPDKEIFNVDGSGGGVHSRDADDDDDDGDDSGKKQRGHGYGSGGGFARDFTKAKQVVLRPFTKAKKQLFRKKNKRTSSSYGSAAANAETSGKRFGCVGRGSGRGKGCYFCFRQPQTLESPAGSYASDPNGPNFTYDMLKAVIEKNDFYSKECNPHLDYQ